MKNANWFEIALTVAGGWAAVIFGDLNGLFWALLLFVSADYITGVIRAVILNDVSSKVGFKGILKKFLIFAVVGLGHMIDAHILTGGDSGIIRSMVIMFYISNEGISILENVIDSGLPVPDKLKSILQQLKNNGKNENKTYNKDEGE